MTKSRTVPALITVGGLIGLLASFIQTVEKLHLLKASDTALVCDLNSVFSCTNVLNAWQSSVFGFPNSLMCIVFFSMMATAGLVMWSGGTITRIVRLVFHGIALFFLGFGTWFLLQSIYVIGALCLYCVFCFGGLLMVNWGWLRLNAADLPFLGKPATARMQRAMAQGADTFAWALVAIVLGFLVLLKFY